MTASSSSPSYEQQLELYAQVVAEYRFQIQLNWDRTKYLIGYNTAVFAAGIGLLKLGGAFGRVLVIGVFMIGLIGCLLTAVAAKTQHGYYGQIRDQMTALSAQLNLGATSIATTPGARGVTRSGLQRLGRVQSLVYALLVTTGLADVLAAIYVLVR